MRVAFAYAAVCLLSAGCAGTGAPRAPAFAEVLEAPAAPSDVKAKLVPPKGACLAKAREYVRDDSQLLPSPMPASTRARVETILDGLHPAAKAVLRRTNGIWLAHNIEGAAAVFLPCDVDRDAARGGFVLVDLGQFPLELDLRDADVPAIYWRSLAGGSAPPPRPAPVRDGEATTAPDHAMRYLVLHELGHALSLLAGEFALDDGGRMQIVGTRGFVGLSWRLMTTERKYLPLVGKGPVVQAVVPRTGLDTLQWGTVLAALDADPALLAPGYLLAQPRSPAARARELCSLVDRIPRAGFVTPTAARYPTEDFAEMFAHAILADEGKLMPDDKIQVELPGCGVHTLSSPYFSPHLAAKRRYMEDAIRTFRPGK